MLVGRDQELGTLADALQERAPALLVGHAGLGKTALLTAATAELHPEPKTGGGLALLDWMAYLPISRALRREPPAADATAVAAFVVRHLDGAALVLDDLQWADQETLGLLPLLAGRVPLLAAVRLGEEGTENARRAADASGFAELELKPLASDEAAVLVRELHPGLDAPTVERVVERAGGNPLLLHELSAGDVAHDALLLSLTARLPRRADPAWSALARLALLHRPAPRDVLGPGVDELLATGLATTEGPEIRLRHELLGEAAIEPMDAAGRRAVHAELAPLLPDAGEAARHYAAAGALHEARGKALVAAERATRLWDRAHHLSLAARCSEEGTGDGLRLQAATELVSVGDAAAALQLLEGVRKRDVTIRAEVELVRARAWQFLGKHEDAWGHVDAGLRLADGSVPVMRSRLLGEKSRLLSSDNEGAEAVSVAREALDLAARVGGDDRAALSMVLAMALYMTSDPESVEHCRAALVAARRSGDDAVEGEALEALVAFTSAFGDPRAALAHAHAGVARARELGMRSLEARLCHLVALLQLAAGEHATSIAAFRELLEEPLWLGYLEPHTVSLLGLALADTGELGEAEDLVTHALEIAGSKDARDFGVYLRAEVAWLRGEAHTAVQAVDQYLAEDSGTFRVAELEVIRGWALDDLGERRRPSVEEAWFPLVAGAVKEARAVWLLGDQDALQDAEALFLEAADRWRGTLFTSEVRCLWGAGEAARRAGALDRARKTLAGVEATAERHGLVPLLARIRRSLRAAGVSRPTATRPHPDGALTAREREVLSFIGRGATSGEVSAQLGITRATVDSHVRSAMRKLGVKTRAQAAAAAAPMITDDELRA